MHVFVVNVIACDIPSEIHLTPSMRVVLWRKRMGMFGVPQPMWQSSASELAEASSISRIVFLPAPTALVTALEDGVAGDCHLYTRQPKYLIGTVVM